jgi:FKBP-type peptidyl-prolyl cis-trans isomerase (trigger factor)
MRFLQNVEVPGFRKGKAPPALAKQQVDMEALEEKINQALDQRTNAEAFQQTRDYLKS